MKVLIGDTAQDHPFQPVDVVEPVMSGVSDGGKEVLAGIFPSHAQQLAQGNGRILAAVFFHIRDILRDLRNELSEKLLFRPGSVSFDSLSASRSMFLKRDPLAAGNRDAFVGYRLAGTVLDDDAVLRFTDFHLAADPVNGG